LKAEIVPTPAKTLSVEAFKTSPGHVMAKATIDAYKPINPSNETSEK
jgi:hypothetical protein